MCSASAASKNGIAVGEAVVFFNPELAREFDYRCKQGGQLASKMRFLSAPWIGMLQGRRVAAARAGTRTRWRSGSKRRLRKVPGVEIAFPVESNAVFAAIPPDAEKQAA